MASSVNAGDVLPANRMSACDVVESNDLGEIEAGDIARRMR